MNFVAIDFETAVGRDSACAVGIVTVKDGEVAEEYYQLIQPPGNRYTIYTTRVHGLTSTDTRNAPVFPEVYPEIRKRLAGRTVVAHNESFDRDVLQKCMKRNDLDYAELNLPNRWECTLQSYRDGGFHPCDLGTLCRQHNIELNHHEALSDARACAKLYISQLSKIPVCDRS